MFALLLLLLLLLRSVSNTTRRKIAPGLNKLSASYLCLFSLSPSSSIYRDVAEQMNKWNSQQFCWRNSNFQQPGARFHSCDTLHTLISRPPLVPIAGKQQTQTPLSSRGGSCGKRTCFLLYFLFSARPCSVTRNECRSDFGQSGHF